MPALGLVISGGRFSPTFAIAVIPLLVLHYAMLLAFEFPDECSDRIAGKRTLVVRIGRSRGALFHNTALWTAIILELCLPLSGFPVWTALSTAIVAPLAIWQTVNVASLARGRHVSFGQITFVAVVIFTLAAVSLAAAFWTVPVVGSGEALTDRPT